MILQEDVIDKKLIALAAKYKAGMVKLIQSSVTHEFFRSQYQPIVSELIAYYKTYLELATVDTLSQSLIDKGKSPEAVTVIAATLDDLLNDPEIIRDDKSVLELDFFIERIQKRRQLEIVEETSKKLATLAMSSRLDAAKDVLMKSITTIEKISNNGEVLEGSLAEFAQPRLDHYKDRKDNPDKFKGTQSGFPLLDAVTDGYQPGELVIYVAESGGGKSVNLLHTAYHAWQEKHKGAGKGANVVLFTIEMDWQQYLRRFDAMHASLDSYKLKSASLDDYEYGAWLNCIEYQKSKQNLFYVVDMPAGCTCLFIRNKLDEIRMKYPDHPIDMVVIDYLGIMEASVPVDGDWLKQGMISQECKQLARQDRVVVVTAVQETRDSIKDGKVKHKNTAVLSRSQMIVSNSNIILYSKMHQIEESDEEFKLFESYNDHPNLIHYQLLKSRDSKKVSFSCGADFSRMLIQPIEPEDDKSLDTMAANGKKPEPEIKPKKVEAAKLPVAKLQNDEDEIEFVTGYYERTKPSSLLGCNP